MDQAARKIAVRAAYGTVIARLRGPGASRRGWRVFPSLGGVLARPWGAVVSVWIVVIAVGEQGGGGKEGEICGFKHFLGWGRGWICGAMGGRVV